MLMCFQIQKDPCDVSCELHLTTFEKIIMHVIRIINLNLTVIVILFIKERPRYQWWVTDATNDCKLDSVITLMNS